MSRHKNIGKFEQEWQQAFEKASIIPPAHVWDRVEVSIANAESGHLRKGLLVFKLLAAASVVFALGITAIGFFYLKEQPSEITGQDVNAVEGPSIPDDSGLQEAQTVSPGQESLAIQPVEESKVDSSSDEIMPGGKSTGDKPSGLGLVDIPGNNEMDRKSAVLPEDLGKEGLPFIMSESDEYNIDAMEPIYTSLAIDLGQPEVRPVGRLPRRKSDPYSSWAGVDMGTGAFSPNQQGSVFGFSGLAAADAETAFSDPNQSGAPVPGNDENTGLAYSVGVGAGLDVSRRWLVQGGLSYIRYENTAFSNTLEAGTIQLRNQQNSGNLSTLSEPLKLNNSYEYLALPIQAGYYLINRKFSWTVSGGVSTDIFLRNRISDVQNVYGERVTTPGDTSPYRPVYFNLLLGTEFGYTFREHYRLSVQPSFRHGITSMFKSEYGESNLPFSANFGFRFTYIFR